MYIKHYTISNLNVGWIDRGMNMSLIEQGWINPGWAQFLGQTDTLPKRDSLLFTFEMNDEHQKRNFQIAMSCNVQVLMLNVATIMSVQGYFLKHLLTAI